MLHAQTNRIIRIILLAGILLSVLATLWSPPTAYAEPAKCIITNTGNDLANSKDDSNTVVDCSNGFIANLHDYKADHYYKVQLSPGLKPTVNEISKKDYLRQVDLIGGGNGCLEGECKIDGIENFEPDCQSGDLSTSNCNIYKYVVTFVRVLSTIVGIVVATMIAVGGIQYASSRDNPQQAAAAKTRIRNAILALILYIFTFAFLQWLVPGGVL